MKSRRKFLLALAVGWFVLFDILLRTTDSAVSNIIGISNNFRGIIRGLGQSYFSNQLALLLLPTLILLTLIIFVLILIAWANTISITRALVKFFFFDNSSNSEEVEKAEQSLRERLFGSKLRNAIFWRVLGSLLGIWVILIVISIVTGIVTAISGY